jgi:hypothetical protein
LYGALALHFDNCRKAFVTKHFLNIHLNYHTGKKPYACRIDGCKKAFPDSNSRFCHEKKVNHFKKNDDNDDDDDDSDEHLAKRAQLDDNSASKSEEDQEKLIIESQSD